MNMKDRELDIVVHTITNFVSQIEHQEKMLHVMKWKLDEIRKLLLQSIEEE